MKSICVGIYQNRHAEEFRLDTHIYILDNNLCIIIQISKFRFPNSQYMYFIFKSGGARWLSGNASDYGARGRATKPTPACCVFEQYTLLPESTGNTQEAMAPSRND